MTDLEQRLADSLAGAGDRAPHPDDLAAGARSRLRRRRRTTAAAMAAAVAVVAVPVGVALVEGGEQSTDRQDPAVVDSVPSDWRVESFRDLTLRVPPDWTYGGGSDWCLDGQDPQSAQPQVSRAGGAVRAIACRPAYGYGVVFAPQHLDVFLGDETFPSDAHYDTFGTEQARVWIAAQSRDQLDRIRASIGQIDRGEDANGCPARQEFLATPTSDRVSVCRYRDGWLEQSEMLSPQGSQSVRHAVGAAPGAPDIRRCGRESAETPIVTLRSRSFGFYVVYDHPCASWNRVTDDAGTDKQVTEDILYWALSPGWSGSVGPGVPLPEELRTID